MNKDVKLIRSALNQLAKPGAVLRQISGDDWEVVTDGPGAPKPSLKLKVSQILKMRSSDLIRLERDGSARLTDTGRSWCLRKASLSDPFQSQHQSRAVEHLRDADGQLETVTVNKAESPLYWLRSRKDKSGKPLLSDRQFQAGERLRRDFTLGNLQPQTTASWSIATGGANRRRRHGARTNSDQNSTDTALAARDRFNQAITAVGPELADPLIEVCCFLRGVEETETKLAWPKRSGKLVLRLALSALARHYDAGKQSAPHSSHLTGQMDPGYRPEMFPGG